MRISAPMGRSRISMGPVGWLLYFVLFAVPAMVVIAVFWLLAGVVKLLIWSVTGLVRLGRKHADARHARHLHGQRHVNGAGGSVRGVDVPGVGPAAADETPAVAGGEFLSPADVGVQ
jgi:hypothetical protein